MGVLEIFYRFPGDISRVSWRYLIGLLVEIFLMFHGDVSLVSLRYLICVLKIFDKCPKDI